MSRLDNAHILVTGATGLIGGEFARALIRNESTWVSCLVRGRDGKAAFDRLAERFDRGAPMPAEDQMKRVRTVDGDITRANLGVAPGKLESLQNEVDIIIHSAAETSFVRSQNCDDINIVGTQRVIEFAKQCRRTPLLVYISTACNIGNVSNKCLREEDGCQPENIHFNRYTQSKAIAENLVRESGLPVLIIRPSIVLSAGIADAEFARQILWVAPLFSEFDCLPIDPEAKIDIVPVSFVVEATLKLIDLPERRFNCYHISAGNDYSITMGTLTAAINQHYGKEPLTNIPASQWGREHTRKYVVSREQRKLYASLKYYLPFLNMDVIFDNSRLKDEIDVEELGLRLPTEYLPGLLNMVRFDEAVAESQNP